MEVLLLWVCLLKILLSDVSVFFFLNEASPQSVTADRGSVGGTSLPFLCCCLDSYVEWWWGDENRDFPARSDRSGSVSKQAEPLILLSPYVPENSSSLQRKRSPTETLISRGVRGIWDRRWNEKSVCLLSVWCSIILQMILFTFPCFSNVFFCKSWIIFCNISTF